MAAQTRIVFRNPRQSRRARHKNGEVVPTMFLAERHKPKATARLQLLFGLLDHSPRDSVVGL
jgi:hypothetical protein